MRPVAYSAALTAIVAMALPAPVLAHGGSEMETEALSQQPARTLAQQAIAELKIRGDTKEAATRLDAALESKDKSAIDASKLRAGTEKLDSGHPQAAIALLDEALSLPLGAKSGKVKHEAGREFQPGTDTQEIVGIVAGIVLLALGLASVAAGGRRRARAS